MNDDEMRKKKNTKINYMYVYMYNEKMQSSQSFHRH